jgi:osmotically-inducible protein OsmY
VNTLGDQERDRPEMATLVKDRSPAKSTSSSHVEGEVHKALERSDCFRGRGDGFHFLFRDGILTVRGRVPTFYLKALLERIVKRVDGIGHVRNQIDVVCNHGLSSAIDASP